MRLGSYIHGENYLERDDVYDDNIAKIRMGKVEKPFLRSAYVKRFM